MKFLRLGERDAAKTPCVLDENGDARDISSIVAD
ncbi:MAG: FAA hydrolase family protein, partial [Alphaproteobacteria bacterium]